MATESVTTHRIELARAVEEMRIWAGRMGQVGAIVAHALEGGSRAEELLHAAHFLADDGAASLNAVADNLEDHAGEEAAS